jgi:hypothetical protein
MNAPISFATFVASTLLLAAVTPGSVAAQQSGQSSMLEAPAKNVSAHTRRKSDRHQARAEAMVARAIVTTGASNAYELVSRLYPEWLSSRAPSSLVFQTPIKVYVDRVLQGGIEALREIHVDMISSIECLRGPEATQRFGTDHTAGAIVVTSVRR